MARRKEKPITFITEFKVGDRYVSDKDFKPEYLEMAWYIVGKKMAEAVGGRLVHPNEKFEEMYKEFKKNPDIVIKEEAIEKL